MYAEKRVYTGVRQFAGELLFLLRRAHRIPRSFRRELSPAFRERLMLAVTAVNGCRYCAWFHSRVALRTGVGATEVDLLLGGVVRGCSPDELPALRYAVHWAERNAFPEPAVRREFEALYGLSRAETVDMALRMIRMGNLLGNTAEYFLSRRDGRRKLLS